ncbi:MAG: carbon storage regulator [Gammaproteobacteria bacterium]
MLFFNRGPSQSIYLSLAEDIDPAMPVGELFKEGPIRIRIMSVNGTQVRIGVRSPLHLDVYREDGLESVPHASASTG